MHVDLTIAEQLVVILIDKNRGEIPAVRRWFLDQLLTLAVIQDLILRERIRIDPRAPAFELLSNEPTGDPIADGLFKVMERRSNPFRSQTMLQRVLAQLVAKNVLRAIPAGNKTIYRLDDNRVVHDIIDKVKVAIGDPFHRDEQTCSLISFLAKHLALGRILSFKDQVAALKIKRDTWSSREVLVAMGLLPTPKQIVSALEMANEVLDGVGSLVEATADRTSPSQGTSNRANGDRSNSLNPNHAAFKASQDNRSNQLNPNNSRYK